MNDNKKGASIFLAVAMAGAWIFVIVMAVQGYWWIIFPIGFGFTAMLYGFYMGILENKCPKGEVKVLNPQGQPICVDKSIAHHYIKK